MKNRREFLKEMAAGAAILGAESKFALAAVKTSTRAIGKSKVVIVRDDKLRTPGPGPDSARVAAMLDHAMQTYAGSRNPVDPWKRIVQPGQVVGLKVNTIAGEGTLDQHRIGGSDLCAIAAGGDSTRGHYRVGPHKSRTAAGWITPFRPTRRAYGALEPTALAMKRNS